MRERGSHLRRRRNLLRAGLLSFVLAALALPATAAQTAADTTATAPSALVEAGFITKFPLFVTWPAPVWQPAAGPLVIGVIGDTPILDQLLALVPYAVAEGSAIEVRRLANLEEMLDCQIVFIAASEAGRLDLILDKLRDRPVLTVADSDGFARRGVHISFFVENQRVRFELNQRACEDAGLNLDFRLRTVARLVE